MAPYTTANCPSLAQSPLTLKECPHTLGLASACVLRNSHPHPASHLHVCASECFRGFESGSLAVQMPSPSLREKTRKRRMEMLKWSRSLKRHLKIWMKGATSMLKHSDCSEVRSWPNPVLEDFLIALSISNAGKINAETLRAFRVLGWPNQSSQLSLQCRFPSIRMLGMSM